MKKSPDSLYPGLIFVPGLRTGLVQVTGTSRGIAGSCNGRTRECGKSCKKRTGKIHSKHATGNSRDNTGTGRATDNPEAVLSGQYVEPASCKPARCSRIGVFRGLTGKRKNDRSHTTGIVGCTIAASCLQWSTAQWKNVNEWKNVVGQNANRIAGKSRPGSGRQKAQTGLMQ